jgi:hypothetical protein
MRWAHDISGLVPSRAVFVNGMVCSVALAPRVEAFAIASRFPPLKSVLIPTGFRFGTFMD